MVVYSWLSELDDQYNQKNQRCSGLITTRTIVNLDSLIMIKWTRWSIQSKKSTLRPRTIFDIGLFMIEWTRWSIQSNNQPYSGLRTTREDEDRI